MATRELMQSEIACRDALANAKTDEELTAALDDGLAIAAQLIETLTKGRADYAAHIARFLWESYDASMLLLPMNETTRADYLRMRDRVEQRCAAATAAIAAALDMKGAA